MAKKESLSINIKLSYVVFAVLAVAIFFAGFFSSKFINRATEVTALTGTKESDCVMYCNLANTKFNSVKEGRCFCDQERTVPNLTKNQTIFITQTLDAGIIKSIEVQQGISQEALMQIQAQQAQG